MVSAIFKHTNDKTYHKILSKNVFNPGLNVYIFRCKLHLLQGVWTNPHSQKACMVSLELFRISTSFPTVPPRGHHGRHFPEKLTERGGTPPPLHERSVAKKLTEKGGTSEVLPPHYGKRCGNPEKLQRNHAGFR